MYSPIAFTCQRLLLRKNAVLGTTLEIMVVFMADGTHATPSRNIPYSNNEGAQKYQSNCKRYRGITALIERAVCGRSGKPHIGQYINKRTVHAMLESLVPVTERPTDRNEVEHAEVKIHECWRSGWRGTPDRGVRPYRVDYCIAVEAWCK